MNAIVEFTNKFFSNLLGNASEQDSVHPFRGGVHPPQHKAESTQTPIKKNLAIPETLILPLRQHIGNMPKICVSPGDHVLKGQKLAHAEGNVSAAIHAPTSGHIKEISEQTIPHPSGLKDYCVVLIPDGKDEWCEKQAIDWRNLEKPALVNALRESGIVGLGGATFPSHIKLRPDGSCNVETLIINAAECEPYITCDDMLMRERAESIAKGIEIVKYMLNAKQAVIGIEDNKPEAEAAMENFAAQYGYVIKRVPTLYPSGDARRLIHLVTGQEVPHGKRSTEIGVQVFNVATLLAIHRYFDFGEPSITRIMTITGAIETPQNFEILFGTPLPHLIEAAGGATPDTTHFVMGGPMMGFTLPSTDIPMSKASNCIIAVTPSLFEAPPDAMPCIRCTRCADACPVSLQPQELYWFAKSDQFDKAREYDLFDCIECGCCTYVCPSNLPLVQHYRYAKSEVISADKAKEAADLARERNEFKLARVEREKEDRARKQAERAAAAKAKRDAAKADNQETQTAKGNPSDDDKAMKQQAIAAAVARAKAKKTAAANNQANSSETASTTPPTDRQAKVQAAIAKASALKAAQANASSDTPSNPASTNDDKQAKIAAAIAKAKAKKASAASTENTRADQNKDDKQAKIAAAKAKARKAQSAKAASENEAETQTEVNEKQAKIQAAIAKAKAAQQKDKPDNNNE